VVHFEVTGDNFRDHPSGDTESLLKSVQKSPVLTPRTIESMAQKLATIEIRAQSAGFPSRSLLKLRQKLGSIVQATIE
jgi:hypothetical protein